MRGWGESVYDETLTYHFNTGQDHERAVIYIHGGSFTASTSPAHFRFCSELALALDCAIYIIEYKTAPNVGYPSIHNQCRDTITSIIGRSGPYKEIILAGDSAGAGIIPAIFRQLDADIASQVKASILMSPWMDYDGESLSAVTRMRLDPWLNSDGIKPVALQYFGSDENLILAQASTKVSLEDQPPTLISIGEDEILFSDALEAFATLLENGILASIYIGKSLWHVWPLFPIRERNEFLKAAAYFVNSVSNR